MLSFAFELLFYYENIIFYNECKIFYC